MIQDISLVFLLLVLCGIYALLGGILYFAIMGLFGLINPLTISVYVFLCGCVGINLFQEVYGKGEVWKHLQ